MARPVNEKSKRQQKLRELAELENRRRKEQDAQRLRDELETLHREKEALAAEKAAHEADVQRLVAERQAVPVEPEPIEPEEIEPLPSNMDEGKEISLDDLLAQETEEKHGAPEEILSPDDAPDGVEFEEESEEEKAYREQLIEEELDKKPGAIKQPKITESGDGENMRVTPESGQTADWMITMMEGFANKTLPAWYEHEEFTARERRHLKLLLQRSAMSGRREIVLTDEDLLLLDRHSDVEDYAKTIPLSESEKETIKPPLERLLREKGVDVPPGVALLIAILTVYGPRLFTPAMKKYSNYKESKAPKQIDEDETES